jgi:FAD/FMN-containing dehydrogenase
VIAPKLCDVGDEADDWVAGEGKAISSFVYDLVTRWNGSISAEHGIGQAKIGELSRLSDPVRLATMQAVKQALDPQGLLNPGKLVPLAPKAVTP